MSDSARTLEYKAALQKLGLVMPILCQVDLDVIIETEEAVHNVGLFLDPTAYMRREREWEDIAAIARDLKPIVEHWRQKIEPLRP